jgi:hypothetical protein
LVDQQDGRQGDPEGQPPELLDLFRFSWTCLALGIPQDKVAGDYLYGLEGLRQQGVLRLEDLARVRASEVEHPEPWAAGFAAGYLSAWAAAVLRVLDTRGVAFDKHLFRALNLCSDADLLTRFLDRATTATQEADLVAGEPSPRSSDGS